MDFAVFSQRLELDVDLATQSLKGRTILTIEPKAPDLKSIRLNSRQCRMKRVSVEGKPANFSYRDPYSALELLPGTTVNQYHILQARVEGRLDLHSSQPEDSLEIWLPPGLKIKQQAVAALPAAISRPGNGGRDGDEDMADAPAPRSAVEAQVSYLTFEVAIDFDVLHFRDGLHFVGIEPGDERYPHLYTCNSDFPGSACSIFPCVDEAASRHEWDISIRYPRTLGDALRKPSLPAVSNTHHANMAKKSNGTSQESHEDFITPLNQEDRALEMRVVCSGNLTDDVADVGDPTRKLATFRIDESVAARHIGFAIGPFEHVNLSEFRESDQDEKLGTHAVRVHGFCLPGRASEVQNTCMPLAAAVDYFSTNYVAYPYPNHKLVFVDDLAPSVADSASMSICSTRLLIPEDILDPLFDATRELLRGLATQWLGVLVFPRNSQDHWITIGGAYFMADQFGAAQLWGKNELRYRLKMAANQVVEQDVGRPSLHDLGQHIADIPGWLDFMKLKAPVVLQILHQRMIKASGRNGVNKIFWRILTNTKTESMADGAISTPSFQRTTEKVGHLKFDIFFNQWVYGSGYPVFLINQKFNKKKLCVEMLIKQTQGEPSTADLGVPLGQQHGSERISAQTLRRAAKEDQAAVASSEVQRVFNGPMTIRIHEADGTPYEHIVEIKDAVMRIDIPYNTKYKRLKRSKRQKERQQANAAANPGGDGPDETLLYCLGDVLQTEAEFSEWKLQDWPEEEETKMGQESYEWIRVDKDFEWISKTYFIQPGYMYVSQLQQDNDVVAQIEALEWMRTQRGTPLMATFLIRTLMDSRYFYGVRTMAADLLSSCPGIGFFHLEKAFQTFYCLPNSPMTRSNDFSNRADYIIQCAIPKAMAKIRSPDGKVPYEVRQFFVDKMKFNDNSNNVYSDCYYMATLMACLAESLTSVGGQQVDEFSLGDANEEEIRWRDTELQKAAIHEIERYRRIDEWIPSFQNLYSVTSLSCILRLMITKTIPRRVSDFLPYTQPGNSDEVRLKAFEAVAQLGTLASQPLFAYCVLSLATDTSSYFRQQLWENIWLGLGVALFSEQQREAPEISPPTNGFVVEQASTGERQDLTKRRESIDSALEALKTQLAGFKALPDALMSALRSATLDTSDFLELLEICEIVYEPLDKLVVPLKYPRYWSCTHTGNAKLTFSRSDKIRTKPYDRNSSPFVDSMSKHTAPSQSSKPPLLRLKTIQRSTSPDLKRRRESLAVDEMAEPPAKIRITTKRQHSQLTPSLPHAIVSHNPVPMSAQASRRPSMTTTAAQLSPPTVSAAPLTAHVNPLSARSMSPVSRLPPAAASPALSSSPRPKKRLLVRLKISRDRLVKLDPESSSPQALRDIPSPASSVDVPLAQVPSSKVSAAPSPAPPVQPIAIGPEPIKSEKQGEDKQLMSTDPLPPPLERKQTIKLSFKGRS